MNTADNSHITPQQRLPIILKRIARITGGVIATPIIIILLLCIALYLPPVQKWAVDKATAYASEQTGMEISIGYVRLACPLDLKIEDVRAIKRDTVPECEIAEIRNIYVDVQFLPLFDGKINIDALEMNGVRLNSDNIIDAAVVKGTLKSLTLKSHGIDLRNESLNLDKVMATGADLEIFLNDSVPEDTTQTDVAWTIAVEKAEVNKSAIRLHSNSMDIFASIGKLTAEDALIDLLNSDYSVSHVELKEGSIKYGIDMSVPLESSPIQINNLYANIDSIKYCEPNVSLKINKLSTPHSTLRAAVALDLTAFNDSNPGQMRLSMEASIGKEDLAIARDFMPMGIFEKLPNSQLYANVDISGNAQLVNMNNVLVRMPGIGSISCNGQIHNPLNTDLLSTDLRCAVDVPDISRLAMFIDAKTIAQAGFSIPYGLPLQMSMNLNGGMANLGIDNLRLSIPGKMDLKMNGHVLSLNNLNNLKTDLCLSLKAPNIDFITSCISPRMLKQAGITIPKGIGVNGDVCIRGDRYDLDLLLTEGRGKIKLDGYVNMATSDYSIDANIRDVAINHYMPTLGIGRLTTSIKAKGQNFDILDKRATLTARGNISNLNYGQLRITGINLEADINKGKANVLLDCNNELLKGYMDAKFLLSQEVVKATMAADLSSIDFQRLKLTEHPLKFGLCSHIDIDYDFGENILLKGLISDLVLRGEKKTFHPDDIVLDFTSNKNSTRGNLDCGDLHASLDAKGSYIKLLKESNGLGVRIDSIVSKKQLDLKELWAALPTAAIEFKAGQENPLSRFIVFNGLKYENIDLHLKSAPENGLNGNLELYGLQKDSLLLDTIRLNLKSDSTRCVYYGQVRNNKHNPDFTFNAKYAGRLQERGATFGILVYDDQDRLGLRIGLEASLIENGSKIRFSRENPILGYKQFTVNKDNYVILTDDNRITADMRLRAADGTGVNIYTDDDNADALQDITVSLSNFNLGEILSSIPYAPNIDGILDGDYHAIIANNPTQTLSVSSSTSVKALAYDGLSIGNVSSDFVYMPDTAGTHHIDAIIFMNEEEICSVVGSYKPEGNGYIDARLTMNEMPMHVANGFIPDQIIGFKGKGDGELTIVGPTDKPIVNGEIFLDSCHMFSVPYGVDMQFSNDPVRIKNSRLLLENFEMYSHSPNPLTLAGYVDFSNLDRMSMNVKMKAENFLIIDSKENSRSETFGKAYVDFLGSISGAMDNLNMQGKLDVLPSTNMSYILRDSPITTDNHLEELVKFVNLKDSIPESVARPALTGFNMTMALNINNGAHVMCYLNADHSNYVDLVGGGNLLMKYSPTNDLTLSGRYTLDGGQMKYSLPIIPLKTFNIKDGSYVEFTGDVMNPKLNIIATEKKKAQVNNISGSGERSVQFECGVIITKTLQNMGLEFTLDAPEDFEISSDLKAMSADMRGKLAVTMLTTGMYLADGNTNNFSMNSALSQFLQGEINNITGNALRTLDLSLGLDNVTDRSGNMYTDYSFKFSKRFFNNRLKITIGGIVSTGNSMDRGQNNSVFDNISLEYRLDNSGSTYFNAFYNNNAYDWLDGNTEEFGGGLLWRRSVLHFSDIFRFKKDKNTRPTTTPPLTIQKDSLAVDSLK